MEFVIWYFIIGVFVTAIHNVVLISSLSPYQRAVTRFSIGAATLQAVVWPVLIVFWIAKLFVKD